MTFELKTYYPLAGQVVKPEHEDSDMTPGERKQLFTDGYQYLVMSGKSHIHNPELKERMTPRYVPEHTTKPKNIIDMAKALADRFFMNAETGINITRSYQEILDRKSYYDDLADDNIYKQPAATLLVGAAVERMRALAQHIHDNPDNPDLYLDESPMAPKEEANELYISILCDEDIVNRVHRRNGAPDIDKEFRMLLSDNIRQFDTGENADTLRATSHAHAYKIAAAMNMIDVVAEECMKLSSLLPEARKNAIQEDIQAFARLSRKAAGIPSSEADPYDSCRIELKAARNALKTDYVNAKRNNENMTIPDTITLGIRLIDDMVRIRIPREASVERFLETVHDVRAEAGTIVNPDQLNLLQNTPFLDR